MTSSRPNPSQDPHEPALHDEQRADIRLGYQMAITLWSYEGTVTWSMFNAMMIANSIIVLAEQVLKTPLSQRLTAFVGIFLVVAWYMLVRRGFAIHGYRVRTARELEERLSAVETVSRGARFNDGQRVVHVFANGPQSSQLPTSARLLRGETLALLVVLGFGTLHVITLIHVILMAVNSSWTGSIDL